MMGLLRLSAGDGRLQPFSEQPHSIGFLITGLTLLRLALAATLPLLPQEAYYWSWSRELDWSYFDHPPLASYSIALTTAIFGQNVFGIKAAAVLWSVGWNLLWARLIMDMYGDRRLAFWAVVTLNLTLMYEVWAVGITPDSPLIFAWTGAIWAAWRLTQTGNGRWWFVTGAFVGLSLLGKYSGVILVAVLFLYVLTSGRQRHWLCRPEPYCSALLAAIIFSPVVVWNVQHEWASMAFQSSRRIGDMSGIHPRYVILLLATQLLLLTPYMFIMVVGAILRNVRDAFKPHFDDRVRLLLASGLVPIALFSTVSVGSLVKLNWLAPAYWSLLILAVRHVLLVEGGHKRLKRGLTMSAVFLFIGTTAMMIPNLPIAANLNSWSGWKEAALQVDKASAAARARGVETFVFSPNYKTSSLLRFYLAGQPRTYAQDIFGEAALQFDYFPILSDLKGATGILVSSSQDRTPIDLPRLRSYFENVERIEVIDVQAFGRVVKRIEIYRCTGYRGHPRWNASRHDVRLSTVDKYELNVRSPLAAPQQQVL